MSRLHVFPLLLCCGCAVSAPSPDDQARTAEPVGAVAAGDAQAASAGAQPGAQSAVETSAAHELAIWRDPLFKQRFAESYLAESDVEPPPLTEDEYDVMQQVVELRGAGQLDQAIQLMKDAAGPKANATFDLTLGKLLIERERIPEATECYQKAVGKHAKFRRAWNDLGLIHYRQGNYSAAAQAFVRVIELGGGSAMVYGLLGFSHSNNEDHVSAESAFRMAAMMEPATIDWRMGLAHSFFKQRRFAEAASLFGALIVNQPDRGELWLRQAQAYIGMNETRKAAENLEMVDRLGHSTADSLNTLGNIYVNEELFDLAAGAYERAIEKDNKGGLQIAMNAAKALAARGARAETAQLLTRIESKHGAQLDDAAKKDLLWLRVRTSSSIGDEEAKVLEQIVTMDPLDGDALIKLGQYHAGRGDPEQAIFHYERAEGITAFEADAKVRHAQLLVGQGKYAEALPLLRRAQAMKPRDNLRQFLDQVERVAQGRQ